MGYSIALVFEDGLTRIVDGLPGETVADAAYRHGVNIPLDCRDGACGTCKSLCDAGRFDPGSYIDDALSADEAAQGYCLPCQMRPQSDCVLRIAATAAACKVAARTVEGRVASVELASPSTIVLAVDLAEPLPFLPGQYVRIGVPGTNASRSYSFSSAPGDARAEFLIRNVPDGAMSRYLSEWARPGDCLALAGPLGGFYLRPMTGKVLMLAGGTGLAPFLSMLAQLVRQGVEYPVHLVYGVTNHTDLAALPALDDFVRRLPGFGYVTCVAEPAAGHPRPGYVTDHLPSDLAACSVYVCGPPPMVEAVRRHCRERGIAPAAFYAEKFTESAGTGP
jgi:benzoate/toluate 1,2-dioxygenase reductase subunit